jgi:hypothetical protein
MTNTPDRGAEKTNTANNVRYHKTLSANSVLIPSQTRANIGWLEDFARRSRVTCAVRKA